MRTLSMSLVAVTFTTALAAQPAVFEELELEGGQKLAYARVLPKGFDPVRSYPALLALPPGGQDRAMVETGLERYWGEAAAERGWIVVSPVAPGLTFFQGAETQLPALLEHVRSRYTIERGRFHLAGVSMGGISAFRLALDRPELFLSLSVLPGYAQTTAGDALKRLAGLPIRLYVGERDGDWLTKMRQTEAALEAVGALVEVEVFAGEGHRVTSLEGGRLIERLEALRARGAQSPDPAGVEQILAVAPAAGAGR